MKRREFLLRSAGAVGSLALAKTSLALSETEPLTPEHEPPFKISLAQWSLHKRLFGNEKPKLDNLDFAKTASDLGINAIEYVNRFFKDKARDVAYLTEMKKRATDNEVKSLLIMCDGEGDLGDPDRKARLTTVENHYCWVEAAAFLGCHSIRVNARSKGSPDEQRELVVDGLGRLCEFAAEHRINVIVENHGGLSSDPRWLCGVIRQVNLPNCGTLPDFGNFPDEVDRYEAVRMLMPYAKDVSAKSYDFDDKGNETKIDYYKMMNVVLDAGYHGYVGIEYEGKRLSEPQGILATKHLLEKILILHRQSDAQKPVQKVRQL